MRQWQPLQGQPRLMLFDAHISDLLSPLVYLLPDGAAKPDANISDPIDFIRVRGT